MLIARAPMRVSLAGGGTDLPSFYERHGGMVVSAAIDKYVYVFISPNGNQSLQISSSDYSTFFRHTGGGDVEVGGKLRYARAFLREFQLRAGYSLFMASEMPPGSGLGSSSALSVALTKALSVLQDRLPSKADVAEKASSVEIGALGMPIGKQDHYASAFGGVNAIHFRSDGVAVERLSLAEPTRHFLHSCVMMFFTDQAHHSGEILAEQDQRSRDEDPTVISALAAIKGYAEEARRALIDSNPEVLGQIMNAGWVEKKKLARGITNERIDRAYQSALDAGATGGKLAGAGGGGFMLLICPPENQAAVTAALAVEGLFRCDFNYDHVGARVLLNNVAA